MAAGELTKRVAVAAVGIPLSLLVVYLGGWFLGTLLAVVAGISAAELFGLARVRGVRPFTQVGIGAAAFYIVAATVGRDLHSAAPWLWSGTVVVLLLSAWLALGRRGGGGEAPLSSLAITLGGALYTGGTLSFAVFLRYLPDGEMGARVTAWHGTALVVYPLAITWLADTAAFFVGRRWGRRKLAPQVSPGKTWEGTVAAGLTATVASALYATFVLSHVPPFSPPLAVAAGSGLVMGVAAMLGDLTESLFKREAGVKDSGHVLPGHGGMLDRLDALFMSIPVAYGLLVLCNALR